MSVYRYDAIVIGAGPAGSGAAMQLAAGGARVVVAEKERLPRQIACGGGLVQRAVRLWPGDLSGVVELEFREVEYYLFGGLQRVEK